MAIAKVTQDYSTRTKDISILKKADPKKYGPQPVSPKFGQVSSVCTGVQKLVQRYAIALLTNVGSQPVYPLFGTNLLTLLQGGNLVSTEQLKHYFNFANVDVVNSFNDYQKQNVDLPQDEQLASATLKDVIVLGDMVSLSILLVTAEGDAVDFVLPLPDMN